jgi:hypothetical protein
VDTLPCLQLSSGTERKELVRVSAVTVPLFLTHSLPLRLQVHLLLGEPLKQCVVHVTKCVAPILGSSLPDHVASPHLLIFQVVLEAEVTNAGALRLYENLGFVRDKLLPKYYLNGNDAYRLKLWFV